MILAKKIRLKPTPDQEYQLWKSANIARWTYNWTLGQQKENYESGSGFIQDGDLRKRLTQLKKTDEYAWLYEVSNDVAKQAVKDACNAYKRFFKGQSQFPRFKSKKHAKPSFYNDIVKLKSKDHCVLISKIGWVKTSEQLQTDCKYSNPRISFDGKYWYLAVGIETEMQPVELTGESLGIDVGIKELAVCSNGEVYKNINKTKSVRNIEKRLRRLQRQVSRKYDMNKKGKEYVKTKNIEKLERKIRLMHRKLACIRNNHIHQTTIAIVKNKPSRIVVETLNIRGMMKNKHLSKSIAKQCLYDFKIKLSYKCEKYGIELVEVDKWYPSSKTCSNCGQIKSDLKLSDRIYVCECGLNIDRDLNASINLANYKLTA